ncbi:hypothetical protein D3C74_51570 [compost metagenome]
MENVIQLLDIDNKSLELIATVKFLFTTEREIEQLLMDCTGASEDQIHRYLIHYRQQKIRFTRYASCEEFVKAYTVDRVLALERLFQEYISPAKLALLHCDDPEDIYYRHCENIDIRFNRFAMHFM